jgi:hypothetical protein
MPARPRGFTSTRAQAVIAGLAAAALAIGGFQTGRYTVDAAAVANSIGAVSSQPPSEVVSRKDPLLERQRDRITIRDIATVPFSELYDVLKSASREQLLAWARDLEQMPRGPRQRAAVTAYYKSLIQVDHHAAIEAVLHAENLNLRDVAIEAMMKAAPESIWADLAEMTAQLSYPGRGYAGDELIRNWSRVDPVAASQFVEKQRFSAGVRLPGDEFDRFVSLLSNWGEIDPSAARTWLEADTSRQTEDTFRAFVTSWGRVDRAAAIDYVVANADRANFGGAINELVYDFVRSAKEDATRLVLLLPPEQAKAALRNVADITNPRVIDPNIDRPADYQRPPEEVARWMVSLPVELWNESIGLVAQAWMHEDALSATNWFDQLRPEMREVAVVSLCSVRQSAYRDDVIKLAWTIRDPTLRERALGAVARSLRPDRQDAIEAVNQLPISDEQKAYLRKVMPEDANGR